VLPGTPPCASAAPSGVISAAHVPVSVSCIDGAVITAAAGIAPAAPSNSFRSSAEDAREVLRGSETPPSPILVAAGTDQLSPCKGTAGIGGLEGPTAASSGKKKAETTGRSSTRIADAW
jgi:hypothetical protein